MTAKIGRPSQRLVTILSILSEVVMPVLFFFRQSLMIEAMYRYRSLVMMLSASSSISFSAASMSCSMCFLVASGMFSCSRTLSSRSKILIAYHLCCASGRSCRQASSICAMACSTQPQNLCWGTMGILLSAACMASFAASSMPVPFSAEISTTLQPSSFASWSMRIWSPFFRTMSIMLIATTTGMPSSTSCVVRYRLRSRLVPSMMFRIASGRS